MIVQFITFMVSGFITFVVKSYHIYGFYYIYGWYKMCFINYDSSRIVSQFFAILDNSLVWKQMPSGCHKLFFTSIPWYISFQHRSATQYS